MINSIQYIPYSIRNNITDPDIAGLLDYLEREMGWEILFKTYSDGAWDISNGKSGPTVISCPYKSRDVYMWISSKMMFSEMPY